MNYSIAVLIHSYNAEKDIVECIKSARVLTDMIIVIDTESVDKTTALAKKSGAVIYSFPYSQYVEPSRQFGIEKANAEWVLILDTDERMTPELAKEINVILACPESDSGVATLPRMTPSTFYKIPRKNIFAKKQWLKHGGWWPDYQIRLIKKDCFKKWPKEIHSTPLIIGQQGFLSQPLLHYFHGDLKQMTEKTIIFENIESDLLYRAGKPVKTSTFFRKFLGELFRRLVKHRGFLDGTVGIMEGIYQAFSKTITYLFLYEKRRSI